MREAAAPVYRGAPIVEQGRQARRGCEREHAALDTRVEDAVGFAELALVALIRRDDERVPYCLHTERVARASKEAQVPPMDAVGHVAAARVGGGGEVQLARIRHLPKVGVPHASQLDERATAEWTRARTDATRARRRVKREGARRCCYRGLVVSVVAIERVERHAELESIDRRVHRRRRELHRARLQADGIAELDHAAAVAGLPEPRANPRNVAVEREARASHGEERATVDGPTARRIADRGVAVVGEAQRRLSAAPPVVARAKDELDLDTLVAPSGGRRIRRREADDLMSGCCGRRERALAEAASHQLE